MINYILSKAKNIALIVLTFCCLIALLLNLGQLNNINSLKEQKVANAAPVAGSTAVGGFGTVEIDKKYFSSAGETEFLPINKFDTVTVRLKYSNTGTQAVQDVQINDSIPSGFTLDTSTFKNCLVPVIGQGPVCSNNFTPTGSVLSSGNSVINISPSAGLYDGVSGSNAGGTAVSATSGVLEIGKKSAIHLNQCNYYRATPAGDFYNSIINSASYNTPTGALFGADGTLVDNNQFGTSACVAGGSTPSTYVLSGGNSGIKDLSTLNNRYLKINGCGYYNSVSNDWLDDILTPGTVLDNSIIGGSNCSAVSGGYLSQTTTDYVTNADMLGNRYAHLSQCSYLNPSPENDFKTVLNIVSDNLTSTGYSCPLNSGSYIYQANYSGVQHFDLLDNSRSQGYIEYTMTSTGATGYFGTNSIIRDGGQNTIGNQIINNATDNFQLYVDNTTLVIRPIIASDIGTGGCIFDTGNVGFITTCAASFPDGKSGTITFTSAIGSCTTPAILPTDVTVTCTIVPTVGTNQPVTISVSTDSSTKSGGFLTAYGPVLDSDITGGSCTPTAGVSGFTTTCTAFFTPGRIGTILFNSSSGGCTSYHILPTYPQASCSFFVIGNGTYPLSYKGSGSTGAPVFLTNLTPEQIDYSITKTSLGGGNSVTGNIGTVKMNKNNSYTLTAKNNSLLYPSSTLITITDVLPIANLSFISAGGNGWTCNYSIPILTCNTTDIIPANSNSTAITVNVKNNI